jgi:hypothetical protein
MKKFVNSVASIIILCISQTALAAFWEPVYFSGFESIPFKGQFECWVEVQYSEDFNEIQLRALTPHPHEADLKLVAVGPLLARYNDTGKFYRFKDPSASAPVKDMVLNAQDKQLPSTYGALILHGNHHDPIKCENLIPVTSGDELQKALDAFSGFDTALTPHP